MLIKIPYQLLTFQGNTMKNSKPVNLVEKRNQLIDEALSLQEFIRGTLVKTKKKCGRKSCRCEKGQLHPHVYISTSRNRRNQMTYIRPGEIKEAQKYIDNYRKLTQVLDEISQLNIALLKNKNQ